MKKILLILSLLFVIGLVNASNETFKENFGETTCVENDYNFTEWSKCVEGGKAVRSYTLLDNHCRVNEKVYVPEIEKDCFYVTEEPVYKSIESITGETVVETQEKSFFSSIWNWFKGLFS
ncbi:MAG: hypothetical protein PHD81_00585 [Candidatus Nanoarchaeia archaeon]|nr:hypothetical protein [Candidatus Nanoarchaeia archaeon]MDD5587586.1 hypothetical protein [Candidatus Nanoarchaeia archaeon]